ncbi:hypothetical protein E1N52_32015 [Paraburkholderia guartelaensis]|uniref:Uncharacterized protein n=1 Tax=Paraburkholderia guartelaensis TaxID=2546446 RepID=A0A4R5L6P6_9BURK|nr:hypothetical protein [Paraburkholderia guartelaensis]TDG03994.1 hypothetical protein E1N52_32015 [Paraburkholderia guartelaensis]
MHPSGLQRQVEGLVLSAATLEQAIHALAGQFPGVASLVAWKDALFTAQPQYPFEGDPVGVQTQIAQLWLALAKIDCLEVKMDVETGLQIRESPEPLGSHATELPRPPSLQMQGRIRKLLFRSMMGITGRGLQINELEFEFARSMQQPLKRYVADLNITVRDLVAKEYIRTTQPGPHMTLYYRGIDFDLWIEEVKAAMSGSESPHVQNFTFTGAVASVQTGANATATVTQNNSATADIANVISALRALQNELLQASLPQHDRDELSAITEESVVELSKAKFSKLKITGLLKVIGETVQVMGAAPDAYKVLKHAAGGIGISLP